MGSPPRRIPHYRFANDDILHLGIPLAPAVETLHAGNNRHGFGRREGKNSDKSCCRSDVACGDQRLYIAQRPARGA